MRLLLCVLFLWLYWGHPTLAQTPLLVIGADSIDQLKGRFLQEKMLFLETDSTIATLEQLQTPAILAKMQPCTKIKTNTLLPGRYYWFQLQLTNQSRSAETNFSIELSQVGKQHYFIQQEKGWYQTQTGIELPLKRRNWYVNANAVTIHLPYQDTVKIYLRVEVSRESPLNFNNLVIKRLSVAYDEFIDNTAPYLFFQGAMLLMFFYNLLLLLTTRDKAYLYYTLYILGMSIYFSSRAPDYFSFDGNFPTVRLLLRGTILFPTLFYLLFLKEFFQFRYQDYPFFKVIQYWVVVRLVVAIGLYGYLFLLLRILPSTSLWLYLMIIGDILFSFLIISSQFKAHKVLATYMILGFLALAIPLILSFAVYLSSVTWTAIPYIRFGILVEIVLFSLGLGYRSNLTEKEKAKAQQNFIKQLEANQKLVEEQNQVLETKVEERTKALNEVNRELNQSLQLVAEQRDDIIASITYARRIQTAILPTATFIRQYIPQFTLLYLPKDIVSGDFYWFSPLDKHTVLLAIADCTGHGVPGAFMTVIGENLLDQIVNRDKIDKPQQILSLLDQRLLFTLQQQGIENIQDGMDITVLRIDLESRQITFASAKRPLWVFEHAQQALVEYKGDRFPIGGSQFGVKSFTEQHLVLAEGDTVYAFTDGFADQFGSQGKMTLRRFRAQIENLQNKDLEQQAEHLQAFLQNWRGEETQTDDVLVAGFRLGTAY